MDRLRHPAAIVAAIGLLLTTIAPVGAAQAEDYARVIRSRHAGATFVQVDGCTQTEVFVSAMDGVFGSRPGPVNKQGLVGVFYRELDICSGPGPRFPVVFSADAQSLDRLVSSSRFGTASIDVTLSGTDGDGNPVAIDLRVDWAAAGAFDRSKVSGNDWFPAGGKRGAHVHTWSHGLRADATATGSITVAGTTTELGPTTDASLEQIRYFCIVLQHPHGGFDVDC
jgi:hypothetical protein